MLPYASSWLFGGEIAAPPTRRCGTLSGEPAAPPRLRILLRPRQSLARRKGGDMLVQQCARLKTRRRSSRLSFRSTTRPTPFVRFSVASRAFLLAYRRQQLPDARVEYVFESEPH